MATKKPKANKKYFTVAEANAALPLVRAIAHDITQLARDLQERHDRLTQAQDANKGSMAREYHEELEHARVEFEREQERMQEYVQELSKLGVELKDYQTGLLDFPCWLDNREIYLCWRLGESEVAHWHEIEAGFAGRQKIQKEQAEV